MQKLLFLIVLTHLAGCTEAQLGRIDKAAYATTQVSQDPVAHVPGTFIPYWDLGLATLSVLGYGWLSWRKASQSGHNELENKIDAVATAVTDANPALAQAGKKTPGQAG